MAAQPTSFRAPRRSRRPLYALGAVALALPLALSSTAASAVSFAPADAVAAIANDDYLPDFQREFIDAVDSDAIWNHDYRLSHEIGPRVAGSAGEDAAVSYVQGLLDSYGFDTELETFTGRSSNFANITPSRYTDEFASWQFRPAANGVFTGAGAPVTGEVIDIGAATTDLAERTDLAGRVVVADWIASAATRNVLLADLRAAGAAAVVLVQTSTSESLPNPGNLPAELTDMVVVAGASNQGKRIRTLLEGAR